MSNLKVNLLNSNLLRTGLCAFNRIKLKATNGKDSFKQTEVASRYYNSAKHVTGGKILSIRIKILHVSRCEKYACSLITSKKHARAS